MAKCQGVGVVMAWPSGVRECEHELKIQMSGIMSCDGIAVVKLWRVGNIHWVELARKKWNRRGRLVRAWQLWIHEGGIVYCVL